MPWVAVPNENSDDFWDVVYEVIDCNGTKGVIGLLIEDADEVTARMLAHRLNG